MSDKEKKVKKVKEPVELDYSKLPDHIWEKHLREFISLMDDIELRLGLVEQSIERLMKTEGKE